MKSRIIGIDFDGTCVTHDFPKVGKDIGAAPVLKKLVDEGHRLILFTMRSNRINPQSSEYDVVAKGGAYLTEAILWFHTNNIPLWGVNENPEQSDWTDSPKPYCHLYIDDAALGCPLIYDPLISYRPFVDWVKAEEMLKEKGFFK